MFGISLVNSKALQTLKEEVTAQSRTLEDIGWINLGLDNNSQNMLFSGGFKKMLQTCRLYYYKNPLAGHWVHLTTEFVFGEGVSVPKVKDVKAEEAKKTKAIKERVARRVAMQAAAQEAAQAAAAQNVTEQDIVDEEESNPYTDKVQEVVQKFWNDPDNQRAFASCQAQWLLSNKVQYEGNIFFILFIDDLGDVRARILNADEVADIIYDPEDRSRPRFYKVIVQQKKFNFLSDTYDIGQQKFVYYADWRNYNPEDFNIPKDKLIEGAVIYHVKTNCDINDKFGVPDLYRGIDWIRAHKDMAGDLATLIKSLSTLAWKKKVKGTTAQVNAIKTALNTKINLSNKFASAGSTQIENEGIDTEPINTPTGGVKIGTDGLKQMQLMVCAASQIFYHYYGDPSTGNLATATSMELPMIKKFTMYQKFWTEIYVALVMFQIHQKMNLGLLPGEVIFNEKTGYEEYVMDKEITIDVDFPPILEKDLKLSADGLETAKRANLIGDESAARMFLQAANLNNIDQEIEDIDFTKVAFNPFGQPGGPAGQSGGADPFGQNKDKGSQPKETKPGAIKPKEDPVKEAIETPAHQPGARFAKKNNYLLQRMSGYRKALAANYSDFKEAVRGSMKTSGTAGMIVGNVDGLGDHLGALKKSMTKAAESYFPVAIDIGKKFLQAHVKNVKETLFEANNKTKDLLQEKLDWNEQYISDSLIPDIEKSLLTKMRLSHDTPEDFNKAINEAMSGFESRVEQYAGAFWHVEEAAVKEAGRGTGVMVNFAGADDESTCAGCNAAMNGNPYLIDEAPEPGSHECDGRCRHALQIIEGGS